MAKPRLLFLVTEDWYFFGHRIDLARAALGAGFRVAVATRIREHGPRIEAAGVEVFPVEFNRAGRNPLGELRTIRRVLAVYRAYRPDIVHHVAMKPMLYGTLAAQLTGVRAVINALTGFGYVFSSTERFARAVRPAVVAGYRLAFKRGHTIVQNRDDFERLVRMGLSDQATLIYGAGVDLNRFTPVPEPDEPVSIVLASRMLRDKGVAEFVDAARMLRNDGVRARFVLVGRPDAANPASIAESQLRAWQDSGVVEWRGWSDDIARVYREAHIVCLPSYREGLPKALLEAAACARPVVTTDVPGCRESVIPGESGLLVPARDAAALARALRSLIADKARREAMGRRGRALAESRFSIDRVAAETLGVYVQLLKRTS